MNVATHTCMQFEDELTETSVFKSLVILYVFMLHAFSCLQIRYSGESKV